MKYYLFICNYVSFIRITLKLSLLRDRFSLFRDIIFLTVNKIYKIGPIFIIMGELYIFMSNNLIERYFYDRHKQI